MKRWTSVLLAAEMLSLLAPMQVCGAVSPLPEALQNWMSGFQTYTNQVKGRNGHGQN